MARRRYQKPAPRREGRQWVIYYWDDEFTNGERSRKKKRQVLGPADMGAREAEKVRDEFLRPLNQGLVNVGSATKFADYVESVYKPVVLPTMAKSTRDRSMSVYKNYLGPAFSAMPLRDISALTVQRYVSGLSGRELSQESKDKVRDVLSSILGSAVQYGLLVKNPVEGVRLPLAEERQAVQTLHHGASLLAALGAGSGAVRQHDFCGGLHRAQGERSDRSALEERAGRLDHHRRAILPGRLGCSQVGGQQRHDSGEPGGHRTHPAFEEPHGGGEGRPGDPAVSSGEIRWSE